MTYLYVAVGGAIGSVMRAWLATVMTRLTGPQFPWGTILINVLGSFLIGFVAAATADNSRYNGLRAFIMVGICGGFTTFSSFSLQTLDLLRYGRPLQAMGNILISVLVCLLAVTAGYALGATTGPRLTQHSPPTTTPSMALIVLRRPDQVAMLLEAARRLPASCIRALTIRQSSDAQFLPSEDVAPGTPPEYALWPEQIDAVLRMHPGIDCIHAIGPSASVILEQSRDAEFIVMAVDRGDRSWPGRDDLRSALFESDRPVLLVPDGFRPGSDSPGVPKTGSPASFGRVIGIAWQDDGRAEKAVRAGLALLREASKVHVLQAGGAAEPPALLRQLNVDATYHALDKAGRTGQVLLRAARQLGVDLLVMGAFARGQASERIFGGVTETMLTEADIVLFLRH